MAVQPMKCTEWSLHFSNLICFPESDLENVFLLTFIQGLFLFSEVTGFRSQEGASFLMFLIVFAFCSLIVF
jgi:hypothetical protein